VSPQAFRKLCWAIVVITLLLSLLLVGSLLWAVRDLRADTSDVTDPSRYQQILSQLQNGQVDEPDITLAHFPSTIPPDATNVRFFYRPHFLQGGTELQLRIVLPAIKVARIDSATKATSRPTTLPANFPGINFRDTNGEAAELPADFQVYVLAGRG
jgi:hypothetical protein